MSELKNYTISINGGKLWAYPANYTDTLKRAQKLKMHFTSSVVINVVHIPTGTISDRVYGNSKHNSHVALFVTYL